MSTIYDVAAAAGVSKTLVSRYLNGQTGVSPASRAKIERAIERLEYRPNQLARSLKTNRTNTIGVLMDGLCTPYYFDLIRGIERGAEASGFRALFSSADHILRAELDRQRRLKQKLSERAGLSDSRTDDSELDAGRVEFFTQGGADGVIIYGSRTTEESFLRSMAITGLPLVFIEYAPAQAAANRVLLDNAQGARLATTNLIERGWKDIRHFQGEMNKQISADRRDGFIEAMTTGGMRITKKSLIDSGFSEESGYRAMKGLIENKDLPDAIFFSADLAAFGAYRALLENGYQVPRDIAFFGFDDDVPDSRDILFPALSTVRQPLFEMGRQAAELLAQAIENPQSPPRTIVLQPELVIRET